MNLRLPIRVAVAPLGAQIAQSGCQACIALNGLGRSPERTASSRFSLQRRPPGRCCDWVSFRF